MTTRNASRNKAYRKPWELVFVHVKRFIHNCRNKPANREQGPLQYQEYLQGEMWWMANVQKTPTAEQLVKAAELNLQLS